MGDFKTKIKIDGEEVDVDLNAENEEDMAKWNIHFDNRINHFVKRHKVATWRRKLMGIIPLAATMAFFLVGFFVEDSWSWCWTFFLAIPAFSFLLSGEHRSANRIIRWAISYLTIAAILLVGFLADGWSWCWTLLFIIPIASIIFDK